MADAYDPDTTLLFDQDPDLVRLRRHVHFGGEHEDIASPVGSYLASRGATFESLAGAKNDEIDGDSINVPLLHCKG